MIGCDILESFSWLCVFNSEIKRDNGEGRGVGKKEKGKGKWENKVLTFAINFELLSDKNVGDNLSYKGYFFCGRVVEGGC